MYIPKNRYKLIQSPSQPLITESGEEYNGPYIQSTNNIKYKGSKPGGNLEKVFFQDESQQQTLTAIDFPFNEYYLPSENDYENGQFSRYLLFLTSSGIFKEVNFKSYIKYKGRDGIESIVIKWYLSKPYDDIQSNGHLYQGSRSKNQEIIDELSIRYPSIVDFLNSNQYLK